MICKCCKKIEPESRWNKRFGKHELGEKCLRDHEHAKSEYISRVCKQAGIKNEYGFLTVKSWAKDSCEIITIIEDQLIDRMDFGKLIYELEDALKDDVLPREPFGSRVIKIPLHKSMYNGKHIFLKNSEINNMIETFYNSGAMVYVEYSDYPKDERLKLDFSNEDAISYFIDSCVYGRYSL